MAAEISPSREASQLHFLYRQLFVTPKLVSPEIHNLNGQTGIVTGANIGLGLECCRELLNLGLTHLVLAVWDENKGNAAREQLLKEAPEANTEVWKLNMSSYDSVVAFAERCKGLSRLDFAILNAGNFMTQLEINKKTQHDEVLQVNYLSTALLTILLLPILQAKKPSPGSGRLVIVGSETAAWCKFNEQNHNPILPAFNDSQLYEAEERYYTSKLLQELLLVQLVNRVPSSVAVIDIVNPGLCYGSNLLHETFGSIRATITSLVKRIIGRSCTVGARTLTDASLNHGAEAHGRYLGDCTLKPMAPFVYTPKGKQIAERLWKETMAELSFAQVKEILDALSKADRVI